jgi:hypothetical protein
MVGSVPSVGLDGSRVAVLVVSVGRVHCRAGTRIAAEGRGPLGHLGTVSFWIPPGAVWAPSGGLHFTLDFHGGEIWCQFRYLL